MAFRPAALRVRVRFAGATVRGPGGRPRRFGPSRPSMARFSLSAPQTLVRGFVLWTSDGIIAEMRAQRLTFKLDARRRTRLPNRLSRTCHGCRLRRLPCGRGTRRHADLVCNSCGTVVDTVPIDRVGPRLMELASEEICSARCSHCGGVNTFPGLSVNRSVRLPGVRRGR
jgi:hypothetical protein